MKRFLTLLLLVLPCYLFAQKGSNDSLMRDLDLLVGQRNRYAEVKEQRLLMLKHKLQATSDVSDRFSISHNLFREYQSYNYDSAYSYIERAKGFARELRQPALVSYCKIGQSFVFLSSGLFKEALDTLESISVQTLPDSIRLEYYGVIARAYSDLADYAKGGSLSDLYLQRSNGYLRKAFDLAALETYDRWLNEGVLLIRSGKWLQAQRLFEYSIAHRTLTHQQMGVAASCLSYVYRMQGNLEKETEWLIRAAIADIKGSTHETVALRDLATLLFKQGDVERAYRFITVAMDDARRYNARQRKVELAAIMPIIESERMAMVEQQRRNLVWFAVVVSLLAMVVVAFAVIIYRQLRRIRKVKELLQETNLQLEHINKSLEDANRIKDEYIGYFFNANSEYIARIEAFQKSIHRKVVARQFDDLSAILKSNDLKKERESLFESFDRIFLKLFPSFVEEFNALFREEDRISPKSGELLSPEMRIFALMRLGIKDNEKIAKFLDYSMSTIYTYKTKIKSKSIDRDHFEERIMQIRTPL
ncbi:DUF6377 domain-containing protein [Acetobacteroides hydrogenigenes]|uniref:DUF6377 domain-containing protein n=1 Tax=Acetobacteroides hydrogenigenes TaxID=979970 RepID=A0A4R2E8Y0_9BACT|nr:DUF6377 domain-containing protein [Acetobacteroides hydrogenigenes]TCN63072.1 hypothetical protein CLV25_11650 [Acetobacteroides hydrogenigenes]